MLATADAIPTLRDDEQKTSRLHAEICGSRAPHRAPLARTLALTMDDHCDASWFEELLMDDSNPPGMLRTRGGGSAAVAKPIVEALSLPSDSCVPSGFEWITQVPPPRLKRSRKSDINSTETRGDVHLSTQHEDAAIDSASIPAIPTAAKGPSPKASPRSQRRGSTTRRTGGSAGRSNRKTNSLSAVEAQSVGLAMSASSPVLPSPNDPLAGSADEGNNADLADAVGAMADDLGFSSFATMDVSDLTGFKLPLPCPVVAKSGKAANDSSAADTSKDDDFDVMLHTATFGAHEPPVAENAYKKVRHNLTERKRVDRLNQLFNRLSAAIDADDVLDGISGPRPATLEDIKTLTGDMGGLGEGALASAGPKKERSKAEVLESALNVIVDLRRQLAEERLSRRLGVSHLDDTAVDSMATANIGSDGDTDELNDDIDGNGTYNNVSW